MKTNFIKAALVVVIILSATVLFAQPGGPGGGSPGGGPPPSVSGPIDSGASMLVLGLAGFAYRRLRKVKTEV